MGGRRGRCSEELESEVMGSNEKLRLGHHDKESNQNEQKLIKDSTLTSIVFTKSRLNS